MNVTGSQKIGASRQHTKDMLLNPETLKKSIPGCEGAEFVDFPTGRQLKLVISVNLPGLKKQHEVFLRAGEVVAPTRVVFISEPNGSSGSIKAVCTVDLMDDPMGTNLNYNASAE